MTLIDKDELLQKFQDKELFNVTEKHLSIIRTAPTIEAVEVVRCKDCELWVERPNLIHVCEKINLRTPSIHFCSYGHKKDVM